MRSTSENSGAAPAGCADGRPVWVRHNGQCVRLADLPAPPAPAERPRVLVLEWTDPPYAPGHWVPEMVERAGGTSALGATGEKSVRVTWDQVRDSRPDVVVCAPCGYHLDGAAAQADVAVRALPGVPVWAIDADGIMVRPGPRLVDGVEALAAILHPEAGIAVPPGRVRRIA